MQVFGILKLIGGYIVVVKKGDKVKVHYTGTLDDGKVFDSSEKREPLEFEVGAGMIIPGFDKAMEGMKVGDEKEITIPNDEAYGKRNPEMIKKVPKEQMKLDKEPQPGMMLMVGLPNDQQMPATITEVGEKELTIDLNHPLADKTLHFKIKLIDIL